MRLDLVVALAVLAAPPVALAAPPGYVIFTVAGTPDAKLPAFNAVAGATNNVAIANPTAILTVGKPFEIAVWSHDVSVTGTCVTTYNLSQTKAGVKKVLLSGVIKSYSCSPNTDWLWVTTTKNIPADRGPAVLSGIVTFGTTKVNMSTPVLIQ